jgi:tRNA1(Val) A37 N6-methylase TrmN6
MVIEVDRTSEDALLGGRLVLRQPVRGHRFGHDAVLLAAATPAHAGQVAVEFGAGVGAAGLALARRVDGLAVTLIEVDSQLTALARDNATRNGLAERVRAVCLDVADAAGLAAAGLAAQAADQLLMNPPFNPPHNASSDRARRLAHTGWPAVLSQWIESAARLLRPGGILTLIWRADGLGDVLTALANGFGAVVILPVHPKPEVAAIRVLVRATKASKAPLVVLPGFVLADAGGKPTAQAEAILRDGAAFDLPTG